MFILRGRAKNESKLSKTKEENIHPVFGFVKGPASQLKASDMNEVTVPLRALGGTLVQMLNVDWLSFNQIKL